MPASCAILTAFAMAPPLCGTITSTSTPRLINAWTSPICRVSSLLADWTKTSAPSSLACATNRSRSPCQRSSFNVSIERPMSGFARALTPSVEDPPRERTKPVIRLTTHEATTRKTLSFIGLRSLRAAEDESPPACSARCRRPVRWWEGRGKPGVAFDLVPLFRGQRFRGTRSRERATSRNRCAIRARCRRSLRSDRDSARSPSSRSIPVGGERFPLSGSAIMSNPTRANSEPTHIMTLV